MRRLLIRSIAISCMVPTTSFGGDFLLRFESIGYVDIPVSVAQPKETVLHSIEVVARSSSAFYGKAIVGKHTLRLRGKLHPIAGDDIKVEVRFEHSVDTGLTIPTQDGRRIASPARHITHTTVAATLGTAVLVGKTESISRGGSQQKKSKTRYVLVVEKYADVPE